MIIFILSLLFVIAVALCYTLTSAETALTYLPHGEAEKLTEDGARPRLESMLGQEEAYSYSTRLWRSVFETIAIVTFMSLCNEILHRFWISAIVTALIMALVSFLIFGQFPRQRGRAKPDKVVKNSLNLVYALNKVLGPLPERFRKKQDNDQDRNSGGYFTEDELREFVERANTTDVLEDEEAQMVQSIFELDETRIRAVMVPRTDMVTIDADETLDNALNLFMRSGYSRVPVLGDDFDDVRGFLYQKDVTQAYISEARGGEPQGIETIMREARFEPESKRVMDLLKEMQRESTHVAVVVDEYGGTAGLVTLEDLIEELVGDISDEFDNEKPEIKMVEDGTFRISSRLSIEELGELFGQEIEEDDVDTVGGLLSKHLGRVPIIGSEIEVSGIRIKAIGTRGRRNQIGTLQVWSEEPKTMVSEEAM